MVAGNWAIPGLLRRSHEFAAAVAASLCLDGAGSSFDCRGHCPIQGAKSFRPSQRRANLGAGGAIYAGVHAQWPAKFGYQEALAAGSPPTAPFLKDEETPSGHALGLLSIRIVPAGDRKLYVIGGIRLDQNFLSSLKLPSGMRVMLYENVEH